MGKMAPGLWVMRPGFQVSRAGCVPSSCVTYAVSLPSLSLSFPQGMLSGGTGLWAFAPLQDWCAASGALLGGQGPQGWSCHPRAGKHWGQLTVGCHIVVS